ncbi:MAG: hypothetical protein US94_C0002G0018 [Berkelbacteria bacterium GW2011_GWB1_38_5]|uniref:Uncharacterized protein n=2 Tax=Candidatus Berkelbacteria TaxID=1618330 RepID=A0A0G0LJ22_9BACT|nr:MAG: hypothetical protein US94_C0002G0018 [Berkelbacteria bacterium GW2011_GWB1_38_5]KKQ91042.1 MAG: hypothetical protein UT15_C0001G0022 [Berkelbacteria bacterium GW2011_GWA1_39_10]
MLITRANTWEQGLRKRTIGSSLKIGPITLKFVTIVLLAVAALFYLAQSTQSATFKYKIMDLESQKSKALTDVKQLEVESARLKSLNEIKNSAQTMNMEPAL